jgi:hypothetical protein
MWKSSYIWKSPINHGQSKSFEMDFGKRNQADFSLVETHHINFFRAVNVRRGHNSRLMHSLPLFALTCTIRPSLQSALLSAVHFLSPSYAYIIGPSGTNNVRCNTGRESNYVPQSDGEGVFFISHAAYMFGSLIAWVRWRVHLGYDLRSPNPFHHVWVSSESFLQKEKSRHP